MRNLSTFQLFDMATGQDGEVCSGSEQRGMDTLEEQLAKTRQVSQIWRRRTQGLLEVYLCEYCKDDLDNLDEQDLSWLPDHNCNAINLHNLCCRYARYILQDADRAGKEKEVALIEKAGKIKELRQKLKVEDELDCLLTLKKVKTQIRSKMESVEGFGTTGKRKFACGFNR